MKRFSVADFPDLANSLRRPFHANYFAMYSSVFDGIVTDPVLMMLPLDDHMVHRGDGVFEAFKAINGRIYNLQTHLDRLVQSAAGMALKLPVSESRLRDLVVETMRAGGQREATVRIFLSRGPGGFSVNPYEPPRCEVYVVVTALGTPFMRLHPEGARLQTSRIPAKPPALAGIKNCNYVPNMLMKKEAIDAGVDFTVGFDDRGFMTEGAVENVGIVSADGRLLFPKLDHILAGTTMLRVMALGEHILPGAVDVADITRDDLLAAREILLAGTTINVAAGVEFDDRPIADGKPGPIYRALGDLLDRDMRENTDLLTTVFP